MRYGKSLVRYLGLGLLALAAGVPLLAAADPHDRGDHDRRAYERRDREWRGHERRERYETRHWVYDNRYHHDHYYPRIGYGVTLLPPGHLVVTFRSGRFFFDGGVWYRHVGPRYVVVRPPLGIVVPVLPAGYSTVWVAGVPYYYANETYYIQQPSGYEVVAPPAAAAESVAPPPGVPAQSAGVWYYCESSQTYYPYVSECREGWRQVPATPPQPPR